MLSSKHSSSSPVRRVLAAAAIDPSRVRRAWDVALRAQLLEPVGLDPDTGETLYRLSDRGRRALRVLSAGRGPTETDG